MMNTIMPEEEFTVKRTAEFNRNDIVIFEHNIPDWDNEDKQVLIPGKKLCRVIAFSGEVVEIINDSVFVNNSFIPFPSQALHYYEIKTTNPIDELDSTSIDLRKSESGKDTFFYTANLTNQQAIVYSSKHGILSIGHRIFEKPNSNMARVDTGTRVNVNNYGPIRIPSPGDTIVVNEINQLLFQNIPGITMGKQVLKEKLYFMLGDNRHNSEDSRFMGLIAQSKMYGVVK
jgi:hypothetical protein